MMSRPQLLVFCWFNWVCFPRYLVRISASRKYRVFLCCFFVCFVWSGFHVSLGMIFTGGRSMITSSALFYLWVLFTAMILAEIMLALLWAGSWFSLHNMTVCLCKYCLFFFFLADWKHCPVFFSPSLHYDLGCDSDGIGVWFYFFPLFLMTRMFGVKKRTYAYC